MSKNKTVIAIALILMFAMTVSFVALPNVTAQPTMKTYAYIGAAPNPVGVGQEVLLHVGITRELTSVAMGWEGLSVTITRPDGKTETLSNIRTDSTGGTGVVYRPSIAGNYTLQAHFPEQMTVSGVKMTPGVAANTTMLASSSAKLILVVKEEPQPVHPGVPLPTQYWTRPIDSQLYEWHSISGNFLGGVSSLREPLSTSTNRVARYNDYAPESAHVLWAKQIAGGGLAGGLMGRDNRSVSYECGAAYEGKFYGSVVIGGVLYYNRDETRGQPFATENNIVVAVDLKTGEELWAKPLIGRVARANTTTTATVAAADRVIDGVDDRFPNGQGRRLALGQMFYWDSYNYHGVYGILWTVEGSTWHAFDAFTGRWIYTILNCPASTGSYTQGLGDTTLFGINGEILTYQINQTAGWMRLWNSSNLVSTAGSWNPHGNIYNATGTGAGPTRAWEWNITIPQNLPGSVRAFQLNKKVVGSSVNTTHVVIWAFSLEPGREGTLLFNTAWSAPPDWRAGNQSISWLAQSLEDNVGIVRSKETFQYWGFSLENGKYLWGPTEPEQYLHTWGAGNIAIYNSKLYTGYYTGTVYCYDIKTGKRLWTYSVSDEFLEVLWSPNWPIRVAFIAAGKVYIYSTEHSPINPKPRGAPFLCLDAETGELLWSIKGMWFYYRAHPVIADSTIALLNSYDNRIYAFGKGPSATTVTASPKVSVHGSSILVEGTVTDISPGTKDASLAMRFPNGVPAVADESMGDWMNYVYMQFPRPTDVKGVEVTVTVHDPNNNVYDVAKATSDANGFYSATFEPPVPGKYTIIASFKGSKAYYGSYAETAVFVESAPEPTPPPTPTPASVADLYFLPVSASTIIAIVIVLALLILLLRKRP